MQPSICKFTVLKQTIARYGTIIKRETLSGSSLNPGKPILLLESKDPFPGYYCSEKTPADNSCKEFSYYLPVAPLNCCHEDMVCRISLLVQKKFGVQTCPAHISLHGKYTRAIRIKNLKSQSIGEIAGVFEKHGIGFHKSKKVGAYLSHIYLKSFFEVHQLDQDIFQNKLSPDIYYLSISEPQEWKKFEQLITYQKLHSSFKNFDAAIGYWMQKPAFNDFIRIYGKNIPTEKLNAIRDEFLKNLELLNQRKVLI